MRIHQQAALGQRQHGYRYGRSQAIVLCAILAVVMSGCGQRGTQADAKAGTESEKAASVMQEVPMSAAEAAFAKRMAGSLLVANDAGVALKDGQWAYKYRINKISKTGDDQWVFHVPMKVGALPVVLPVPVRMQWAADTPVLIVDGFSLPGMGPYDSRIVFHGERWAGTWSGPGYGGHVYGQIISPKPLAVDG